MDINLQSTFVEYRTVTGVNGPLVILDNVKVIRDCVGVVSREQMASFFFFWRFSFPGGRGAFDTLPEKLPLLLNTVPVVPQIRRNRRYHAS